MKKVASKFVLVIIQMIMILSEMFQTIKGLKAFSVSDEQTNSMPMLPFKDQSLTSKIISGLKLMRLANDRNGNKRYGLYSLWNRSFVTVKGKMIILAGVANPNPVITATISAPVSAEGKAKCAENIQTLGASTTYVSIPPLQLAALTPLIAALRAAKGEAAVDYAWNQLNAALKLLMRIVQDTMDANYAQSVLIAVHYGYHPKGKGGSHAHVFQGAPGALAGTIDMDFPTGPQGCCYDIRLYNADRTTFTRALPSDLAHAIVGGLVSGSLQNISVTQVIHGVEQEESQIIAVRVK
jgi:hypothetical protein